MKKGKLFLIVAFVSVMMLFAGTVQSEEKKSHRKGKKTVSKRRSSQHSHLHLYYSALKLTEEQKAQIKKIIEDAKKKIKDEVLTIDQKKKLENEEEKKAKREEIIELAKTKKSKTI